MNMSTSSKEIEAYGFFPRRFETKKTTNISHCNNKEKKTTTLKQSMKSFLNNKNKI